MAKGKAATTMIFVSADRVARLDLGDSASPSILFSWQSARLAGQSLEQAVEAALDMTARCGRSVWVLCEDSSVWTQMLSLSAAAVSGLNPQQLERVLGFELESLSGVAASDSHVAFVPCKTPPAQPGQQDYWVMQIGSAECRQVQQIIRQAGGALRGLLHPGAVPGLIPRPQSGGESLSGWLIEWATLLGQSPDSVPVIRLAEQQRSTRRQVGISIGIAAAALAACLGVSYWLNGQTVEISRRLKEAELPGQQAAQLNQRLAQSQAELRQLSIRREKLASTDPAAALAEQRRRIAALLTALGGLASDNRVVTGLKPESTGSQGGQAIEGLSLSPESADELAVGLAARLAGAGWEVKGAQKTARLISADGGPWEFRISLVPVARPSGTKTITTASSAGTASTDGPTQGGKP